MSLDYWAYCLAQNTACPMFSLNKHRGMRCLEVWTDRAAPSRVERSLTTLRMNPKCCSVTGPNWVWFTILWYQSDSWMSQDEKLRTESKTTVIRERGFFAIAPVHRLFLFHLLRAVWYRTVDYTWMSNANCPVFQVTQNDFQMVPRAGTSHRRKLEEFPV